MTSYAILGTGAIGGWYGARLHRAGHDVHFLCRSDYDQVAEHGLVIESPEGDIRLTDVEAYADPSEMPVCDVVLVTWKTTANEALGGALANVANGDSTVVMMQNGLGNEEAALDASDLDPGQVLAGLSFICSHKVGPGHIRHLDYGAVTLAGESQEEASRIARDLADAGVPASVEADRALARWRKLVWNIPYNGLAPLLDATTDALMADPGTRAEVEAIMHEVRAAAGGCEVEIPDTFSQKMLDDTDVMEPYTPSTKLDFDRGTPMEVEAIFGNPVRAAHAAGVDVPRMELLYRVLRFVDRRSAG